RSGRVQSLTPGNARHRACSQASTADTAEGTFVEWAHACDRAQNRIDKSRDSAADSDLFAVHQTIHPIDRPALRATHQRTGTYKIGRGAGGINATFRYLLFGRSEL